ncbi:MAG: OmpA family protein [Candidatus Cloacimonetes bacterium]|nr:OmpA family protein [Candidatus Cloacimonadota bacterium]
MLQRDRRQNSFNVWTVFTDASLCFLIIILMVFIVNTVRLNSEIKKYQELAKYAETAKKDRNKLIEILQQDPDLSKMIREVKREDKGSDAAVDTVIVFSQNMIWKVNNHYMISQLEPSAVGTVQKFGRVLKDFLNENDGKDSSKKRYETYTILIIGHANTDGDEYSNYALSQRRADAIRSHLFERVFTHPNDRNKYKILACGYGENHLITSEDKVRGDRCIEIVFKYDEMDMVKGIKE